MTDLHQDGAEGVHLDLMVPVHAPGADPAATAPIAVIGLQVNPRLVLFSIIQSWPTASATAETLMVRRKDGEVLFLDASRHQTGTAMNPSLDRVGLPTAMVAQRQPGFTEGVDYRGVPVVAVLRNVPNSPWSLVAKMEQAEIYAASRAQAVRAVGIMALLILVSGLGIVALWRQRNLEYFRATLGQQKRHAIVAERFEYLMRQANDLILLAGDDGKIVEANDRAVQVYGLSSARLRGMEISELCAPELRAAHERQMAELEQNRGVLYETVQQRADGSTFPVEVSARLADIGGVNHRLFIVRDITERRRSETELHETQQRLALAVEGARLGLWDWDLRTNAMHFSREYKRQLGYEDGDSSGDFRHWEQNLHPDDREWTLSAVQEFIKNRGEYQELEFRLLHRDGSHRWMLSRAMLQCGSDGEPERIIGCHIDITDRKLAEEALRRSEENLELAERIAHVGYWERPFEGDTIRWSDEAYRVFGLAPQERPMNLASFLALVHPEDRDVVAEAIRATREEDRPYNIEYRIVRPDGTVRFVYSQGELFLDALGRPDRMFGTMLDITERRRVEGALRESQGQTALLVDMWQKSSQPFGMGYADGRLGMANDAVQRLLGYTAEELSAIDWIHDITPREWIEKEKPFIEELHRTGIPVRYEKEYLRKDGTRVPVEVLVHLARDEQGGPDYYYAFITDITERKHAATRLLEAAQRWRSTFDAISDAIFVLDTDGIVLQCNRAAAELVNRTPHETLGYACHVLTHETDCFLPGCPFKAMLATGQRATSEMPHKGRWFDITVDPMLNAHGDLTGAVHVMTDITERRNTEDALRESEQRFRLIAENTGDVIWRLDAATRRFTYISPSVQRLRGFTPEEVMAQDIEAALTPESHARLSRNILERVTAFETGNESVRIMAEEVEQPHKDGHILTTEVVSTLLADAQGKITEILGVTRDITERKRVEKALRDSEQRFRLIAENTGDVIWQMDLATLRFTYVSPSVVRLRGYTPEEIMAQPVEASLTPESFQKVVESIAAYLAAPEDSEVRSQLNTSILEQPCKDGSIVVTEVVTTVLTDSQGNPTGVLGVSRNVTERRRAEQEVLINQGRLKRAQAVGHIGSWEYDPRTRRIWGSEEACRILGMPPVEGDLPVDIVEARVPDWERVQQEILRQLDEHSAYDVELAMNPIDGSPRRSLRVVAELVLDEQGLPTRLLGVAEDITEQKRIAEALRETQERLRLALESSGVGTLDWIVSEGRYVLDDNTRHLFGLDPHNGADMAEQFMAAVHPEDRDRVYAELLHALKSQSEIDTEFRMIWPDQSIHDISGRGKVHRDASGRAVRITGVCWDISARKEIESTLKAYSDRLGHMVDERTQQLRDAQDELVRKGKLAVLGQLAGGVGHELRNPLGVISNAVYFLKLINDGADETTREYLNIISSEVYNSQKIISDLLGFARTSRADRSAVSLSVLVTEVLAQISPSDDVKVIREIPEDLPLLSVDPGQVKQVLSNIILNACQAMPGGGVLTVVAQYGDGRVRISVADTGCGMSGEELSQIFEPLYSTKARGIGLGLSVTKNLVEANDGKIEVSSEPGKGSTFTVVLPVRE